MKKKINKKKKIDRYPFFSGKDEKAWAASLDREQVINEMIDVFDSNIDGNMTEKTTETYDLDSESLVEETFPPIITPEEEEIIRKIYENNPHLKQDPLAPYRGSKAFEEGSVGSKRFHPNEAWIQTYSGRRFNPTNPYSDAIVIQDIAHPLSMQCRFSGHVKKFYSVAQHSVLVSYICDSADALWGLMHDASEAYLVDVPRPIKRSGKFGAYLELEAQMQKAICQRFDLPEVEPPSVKKADTILLATEARDLMAPLHPDWIQPCDPLPFKIEPLPPQEAKNLFMKRFYELRGHTNAYEHYLKYEANI